MNEIKIVIPDIPKSMNTYAGRNARFAYKRDKEMWEWYIASAIRERPKQPFKRASVLIHYAFKGHTRRDRDNYSGKFLFDPLVRLGILEDDSFFCVVHNSITAEFGAKSPSTTIVIKEVGENAEQDS